MLTGQYLPGDSLVHRARPGVKLAILLVLMTALVAFARPLTLLVVSLLVVVAYSLARVPPRVAAAQVWPLRWWVVVLVPFQAWTQGWITAVVVVGTLVVGVAAASVVTLTTRVSAMLATIERLLRPFRRLGVDAERVGLVLALTIRSIPVLTESFRATQEARAARGLERQPRAVVTPFAVRTVRYAERVGESLAARGVDD